MNVRQVTLGNWHSRWRGPLLHRERTPSGGSFSSETCQKRIRRLKPWPRWNLLTQVFRFVR